MQCGEAMDSRLLTPTRCQQSDRRRGSTYALYIGNRSHFVSAYLEDYACLRFLLVEQSRARLRCTFLAGLAGLRHQSLLICRRCFSSFWLPATSKHCHRTRADALLTASLNDAVRGCRATRGVGSNFGRCVISQFLNYVGKQSSSS